MIIRNDIITEASLGAAVSDLDAQAYINRLLAIESVDSAVAGYINEFYLNLKKYDIFSKIRLMYPMVGSKKESILLEGSGNYKVSGVWLDLYYSGDGTTTFDSDGISSNGEWWALYTSNNKPSAEISPLAYWNAVLQNVNNAHMSVYSKTSRSTSAAYVFSGTGGGSNNQSELYLNTNSPFSGSGGGVWTGMGLVSAGINNQPYTETKGFFVSSRTSATDMKLYNDAVQIGSSTADNTGGSFNANRISVLPGETITASYLSIGNGLDATDVANYYSIVQDLQVKLSREN